MSDEYCSRCCRLLPVPKPRPEGDWPAPKRRYCSEACRVEAARERDAKTPSSAVVLLACVRTGIALEPDAAGGLHYDARTAALEPAVRAGLRRHEKAISASITRARAAFALLHLEPRWRNCIPWYGCHVCGEPRATSRSNAGAHCHMTYACPGRLVVPLCDLALNRPIRPVGDQERPISTQLFEEAS